MEATRAASLGHGAASGAGTGCDGDNRHGPTGRHAACTPAAAPAPPPRSGGAPISLEPQAGEPAAAPPARARTAAIPPPAESAASGFVVQLSSQKTESEAQASFRSLQAKFPNELGGRQPIIRRADLGSKGVFYRTMLDRLHRPRRRASSARTTRPPAASASFRNSHA